MIAANVDYVVIVQSCHFDFNLKRLERYLVMVMDGGAEPYILLTKTDLVDPAAAGFAGGGNTFCGYHRTDSNVEQRNAGWRG